MISLEDMLYSGGDERLHFDERTHFNRYMCTRTPNDLFALGASTASTISVASYEATKVLKAEIEDQIKKNGEREAYSQCLNRQTEKLRTVCGFGGEINVALYPSGTDCFRAAADALVLRATKSISAVIIAPTETGTGVYGAMSCVSQTGGKVVPIDVRLPNGCVISPEFVSEKVKAAVTEIVEAGGHVILVLTDLSKTGILSPALDTVLEIERRWPDRVNLLVDACQMRLSAETLRAYLARGWPVIITGSKFWGGPPFSGALLTSCRGAFAKWISKIEKLNKPRVNFGMLLRWEAALVEADRFLSLPPPRRGALLHRKIWKGDPVGNAGAGVHVWRRCAESRSLFGSLRRRLGCAPDALSTLPLLAGKTAVAK